jgi:hypothetical protein
LKRNGITNGLGFETDPESLAFSEPSLTPVFELNGLFLELLAEAARNSTSKSPSWSAALRPEVSQLTPAARARIARCPVCLIDVGFHDVARWGSQSSEYRLSEEISGLPPGRTIELTQMTVTLAWTIARESPEAACIIFGMTPDCVRRVSDLSLHRIPWLAERNSPAIRPAWAARPQVWQHLLSLSDPPPASRLPPLHVHAMQRQLADLALATSASQPIRQPHR